MTTTETGWEWQRGTLYRRRLRRWVGDAVMSGVAAVVLLIVPGVFLVPSLRTIVAASWGWSADACIVVRGSEWCAPAWVFALIGAVLLVGWLVALVDVVRSTVARAHETEIPLSLDDRALHVTISPTAWHRARAVDLRWEHVVTVEPSSRGQRTLRLRLDPRGEITPSHSLGPTRPVTVTEQVLTVECGDAGRDGAVLRHFLDPAVRRSLATEACLQEVAHIADAVPESAA